jgi:16S rRNA (adenine1518-N6/adenine1519-N6)-dimethyltransferase
MALQDLVRKYNINFKKSLGQNLLMDDNINRIMVEAAALGPDDDVVEVGAGLGALTKRLREHAGRVLAVEIDRAFMPCLEDQFGEDEKVRLFRGDILNHDLDKLLDEYLPGGTQFKMVSNLPYYITSPILFAFWESPVFFSRIVIMVQEEVASRMVAAVGGPDYGQLTVMAHFYADVDIVHRVPRTCFRPMPKVDSAIVRLRTHEQPRYGDVSAALVSKVVRTAFSHRRKTLRNALTATGTFGAPKDAVLEAMEAAGIDPGRRAQTLGVEEFVTLAREIKARLT